MLLDRREQEWNNVMGVRAAVCAKGMLKSGDERFNQGRAPAYLMWELQ